MSPVYLLLIVTLFSAVICYRIAKNRGANTPFWVLMGALFGPLAIPFVFFSKPRFTSGAE